MRFLKFFIESPKWVIYNILRYIFRHMPRVLRRYLYGPSYVFAGWLRGSQLKKAGRRNLIFNNPNDIKWDDFNSRILSKRDQFKGIFIQECIVDWNIPLFQRPQHIASALGRLGYLVIYKTVNFSDDDINGFREVCKNVWVTNREEIDSIEGVVRSVYSTAYVHTPYSLLKSGKRGTIIYEYIDHIDPKISGDKANIKRLLDQKEFAFSGGMDFIVASAQNLYDEAVQAVGEEKILLVQNGVDTRHYRNPSHIQVELPKALISFQRKYSKIIGYFGALAPWLWYEVISELVRKRSDLGFVFIGPDYCGGSYKLPVSNNVLYMGTVDYNILPAYAMQFDVCFIPFEPGDIARSTSPLKLFEYFALEKPVVATSEMLECTVFPEVFHGDSAVALSSAIDEAFLVKDDPDFKARLSQLADENNWDERAKKLEIVFR